MSDLYYSIAVGHEYIKITVWINRDAIMSNCQ